MPLRKRGELLQLEDAKRLCDDETKERQSLLGRFRNLEHEYDGMNVILEEEVSQTGLLENLDLLGKRLRSSEIRIKVSDLDYQQH